MLRTHTTSYVAVHGMLHSFKLKNESGLYAMKHTTKATKKPMIIRADRKYKMNEDEVQMHLHLKRKGASTTRDNAKYRRKPKHTKHYA